MGWWGEEDVGVKKKTPVLLADCDMLTPSGEANGPQQTMKDGAGRALRASTESYKCSVDENINKNHVTTSLGSYYAYISKHQSTYSQFPYSYIRKDKDLQTVDPFCSSEELANLRTDTHTNSNTHTQYHSDTLRTEQSMSKQLSDPRASMDPILRKAADADESQSDA